MNSRAIILMTTFNAEKFIKRAIDSVINQTYKDWLLFIVDDCSEDSTHKIICESYPEDKRIVSYVTGGRYGKLNNFFNTIKINLRPDDIVVVLDGDDYFGKTDYLEKLMDKFKNPDIKIVTGSAYYESHPSNREAPDLINPRELLLHTYPQYDVLAFKVELFLQIPESMFKDGNGNWLMYAADPAMNYPMLYLAGIKGHDKLLLENGYIYNDYHENSEGKDRKHIQVVHAIIFNNLRKHFGV